MRSITFVVIPSEPRRNVGVSRGIPYIIDMELQFTKEQLEKIERLKKQYRSKSGLIMPVLDIAQEEFTYISDEAINLVAKILEVPEIKVAEVATFYTMYNRKPVGKYHIQLCQNISCFLRGSEKILEYLKQEFDLIPGKTTDDKKFTLSTVECLGACGNAPMVQINDEYYEGMDKEKLGEVLKNLA